MPDPLAGEPVVLEREVAAAVLDVSVAGIDEINHRLEPSAASLVDVGESFLKLAGGVQKRAAEKLKVKPTTLHEMMKRLKITAESLNL